MFKYFNYILISIIFLISNKVSALNSSSYLISNTAFNLYDFEEAYIHFENLDISLLESDLNKRLFTLINLNKISEAKEIAKNIIDKNILNEEAWIVYLTDAKISNDIDVFKEYKKRIDKKDMTFLNYIFFNEDLQIKSNEIAARSILEIVRGTLSETQQINYSFLLFYLSLANILDPNLNESYFFSAQIYQDLKKYEIAEIFYKKVSSSHDLYFDSQKNISLNKSKLNFFKEGEDRLLELIDNNPSEEHFIIALADLYRFKKKYEQAILFYTKVIKDNKKYSIEDWQLLYLRGICYERIDKWNLAEKDFLLSLEFKPNTPQVLNYLAYGWLERGLNLKLAMQMLQKAYKANPQSYYILDSLAWAYYKINKFQKAAELMEEVIVMAPGEAISLDHLGDIYFAMQRKREASFFWKQALDLVKPGEMIAEKLQKKLNKFND